MYHVMPNRRPSKRPEDQPMFTNPTGMDFDRRRIAIPPGNMVHLFSGYLSNTEKSASFTAGNETIILADATGGDIDIQLPTASNKTNKEYYIKKVDSTGNTVTINAGADDTIEYKDSFQLNTPGDVIHIACTGTEWFIIGGMSMQTDLILRDIRDLLEEIKLQEKVSNLHLSELSKENISEEDVQ